MSTQGRRGARRFSLALLAALAFCASPAHASRPHTHGSHARAARIADAPSRGAGGYAPGAPAAPSGPPINGSQAGASAGEEETGTQTPQSEADPLVSNGLGSPLCDSPLGAGELSAASRAHCETSGFASAPAPTGNYGLDVHIDTGVLGLSQGGLQTAVQDLFITPLWMALVWAVHALLVMLEWCFTIDLLDSGSVADGVASGLRRMQSAFTEPWLATVLAVAGVLAAYNGLVRRRIAETAGQSLLALAMMAGGMWVMLDPTGTIGALGEWANEASLGTLAVSVQGSPARAGRALSDGLGGVFATAIEVPWCYLEFGDVGWCRNPAKLDPQLHAAALRLAASESALISCRPGSVSRSLCVSPRSAQAGALEHSTRLLRAATTNGAIFLALPANGPGRNAINDSGSLLHAICRNDDAKHCRGPSASQAEFRTNGGTWPRVGGLLLIVAGLMGMLLLLGFLALRLLAAALISLLYLMLAPAAVLAPALGDAGRAVFRRWAAQLLGAVVSKLLFSLLLGVVLAILAILARLEALGWWTQWLLMSAFWWGAFARRHQTLGVIGGRPAREPGGHSTLVRRVDAALRPPRRVLAGARAIKTQLAREAPAGERRERPPVRTSGVPSDRSPRPASDQARMMLEHELGEARERINGERQTEQRIATLRAQHERVEAERGRALARADTRRGATLASRAARIAQQLEHEQSRATEAREITGSAPRAGRRGGGSDSRLAERDRFLDRQAELPARARSGELGRDYLALAGLAGYGRGEYERLEPRRARAARLEIDRQLALRHELSSTRSASMAGEPAGLTGRVSNGASETGDRRATGRRPAESHRASAVSVRPAEVERSPGRSESSVMRDAREVAARRKRQLGHDRR